MGPPWGAARVILGINKKVAKIEATKNEKIIFFTLRL